MSDRRPSLLVYIAETSKAADLLQLLERMHADRERYARGIYAPGEFAFPIIEQPKNNDLYVSSGHGVVTDYHLAEQNGTTGLLAHNLLAGPCSITWRSGSKFG